MERCVIRNPGAREHFPSPLKRRGSQEGAALLGNGGLGSGERALEQLSNRGTITCGRSDSKRGERDGLYVPRAFELTGGKRKPSIVLAAGLLAGLAAGRNLWAGAAPQAASPSGRPTGNQLGWTELSSPSSLMKSTSHIRLRMWPRQ